MKYKDALEYMENIQTKGIVPGLDSIRALCKQLGNPQDTLSFLHIAGTNGKGSTLAYLSTILAKAGYVVGRYSSPAILEYRERFQVNGKMISQKDFGNLMEKVRAACEDMVAQGLSQPTAFEVETALAFLYFAEKKCQLVVLETGMGGTLDATNLIETTLISVITSISMDHMGFLGKTIEQIAAHKAGIIKPGKPVVTTRQQPEVFAVISKAAESKQATLTVSDDSQIQNAKTGLAKQTFDYGEFKKLEITLSGTYQLQNCALALDVILELRKQGYRISEKAIRQGLKETTWPGRFTVLSKQPLLIADGAHNEDAAKKLRESIDFYFTNKRIVYIMGMLKDKECEKVIAHTCDRADQIITLTPPENKRALPAYELAGLIQEINPNVTAASSVEEALEMALLLTTKEDVIIAFGSLSYLGRLMRIVEAGKVSKRKGPKGMK